jgi:hypothetical protein
LDTSGWIMKTAKRGSRYFEDAKGEMVAKICNKCSGTKALVDFRNEKRGLGGKMSSCRSCDYLRKKAYKEANADKIKEQNRKYEEENADKIKERRDRYNEENREKLQEYYKEYRKDNHEKILEAKRKWREANPEKQRACVESWERNNPDRVRIKCQKRRARKALLPDDLTAKQMDDTLTYFGGGCALTGDIENVHWDHALPISLGVGGTTVSNMLPLRGDINQSKGAANLFEWFNRNKERFNLSQERFDNLIEFLASKNEMSSEGYRSFYFAQFEENDANAS